MNTTISRAWATPLVIGAFALMAVTGTTMFFHLDNTLQKEVHEWAGWVMLGGVALHALANWPAFKRYFLRLDRGALLIGAFVLVVAGSFLGGGSEGASASPPVLAIGAITRAPIAQVAPLFGKTVEQARSELAAAGITLASDDATLAAATQGNREQTGRALAVLARKP
jgi:hypothetical protein